MSLLSPTTRSADSKEAAEKMEALLVQQLVSSAHLLGKSDAPGASLRADLFSEALAEAVAHSGSIGIAGTLTNSSKNVQPGLKGTSDRVEATHEAPRDPRHV